MAQSANELYAICWVNTTSGAWGVHEKVFTNEKLAQTALDNLPEDVVGFMQPVEVIYYTP